jgi:hypothetical protein
VNALRAALATLTTAIVIAYLRRDDAQAVADA